MTTGVGNKNGDGVDKTEKLYHCFSVITVKWLAMLLVKLTNEPRYYKILLQ